MRLCLCSSKWQKLVPSTCFRVLSWDLCVSGSAFPSRRVLTWLCFTETSCLQFCSLYDCVMPGREGLAFLQCLTVMALCDLVREVVNHILMWARAYTAWVSSQSLPGASKSLKLSLNVLCTDVFFFLRTVGSHVPFTFIFLFWEHKDQKGDSKQREGSAGVWFVAHRGICGSRDRNHRSISGNIFTAETPLSVFVKQLLLAVLLLASCRNDAKTTIAAKETSSCLPSFSQITRIRRRFGFIRKKEFVMWHVLTLYQVMSRADVALLVGLWHINSADWQIFLSCICWAMMKGLTLSKRLTHTNTHAHTHQIRESDETYVWYYSNLIWLPACK